MRRELSALSIAVDGLGLALLTTDVAAAVLSLLLCTFETCRRTVTMSVYRGRAEVVGTRPNRRE